MTYQLIKNAHITFAIISISFFIIRAWWSYRQSPLITKRWVKTTPHINDTLLLACAIYLMITIHQYPFVNSWLTAKVLALLAYIGFGTIAIKRGKLWAGIVAVGCFGYIVMVALAHNPFPF
ncbi:SirB2 family protein [Porticoccaceae bacterium LTM1]|nr:SirB2 family protein [Porticoccaceae bacterium LTM1]